MTGSASPLLRSRVRLLAAVIAGALLLAGCIPSGGDDDGGGSTAGGDAGGTLIIGTTADVDKFNPLNTTSRTDMWILQLMYPHLMEIDDEGQKSPYLATEWRYEDGGRTGVVEIRDDFTWSDGTPLTAEDVAFTANTAKAEQLGLVGGMVAEMTEAVAVDETTVEFRLEQPYIGFLTNIGFWMPIVPKHVFEQAGSVAEFANDADWVGAGPFTLTEVERGQRYVLERVEDYPFAPDGVPAAETVEFRVFPDVNTLLLALRDGDIAVSAVPIPVASVAQIEAEEDLEIIERPSLGFATIAPNQDRPPLDRLEVRQALAMLVDREQIIDVVFQGSAMPSDGVVSPVLTQWDDESVSMPGYDPDGARRLLTDAGFQADASGNFPELTFEMIYDQGDPNVSRWAQLVRDSAAEAGVTIELSGIERNTYVQRGEDGDYDLWAGSWAIMDEPVDYMGLAYTSAGDVINRGNIADPELDRLVEQGRRAPSVEEAKAFVTQAEQRIADQAYDIPLYVQTFQFAYNTTQWEGFIGQPSELLGIINPRSLANVTPAGDR